jgi:hypothetical protein
MSTGHADLEVTIDDTVISGSQVSTASPGGQAVVFGAGRSNGTASGPAGSAHGVESGTARSEAPPPFGTTDRPVKLRDVRINGNEPGNCLGVSC